MKNKQIEKLDILILNKENSQQTFKEFEIDTTYKSKVITCEICKERFAIQKPEYYTYESGNTRFVLEPIEQTAYCPFCGK